ncbi:Uncharacterised protein [Salmonella enterica subsp. arizonae]|nr:Uncharacterised protein [Salmonella enterica subsp. arizonae]
MNNNFLKLLENIVLSKKLILFLKIKAKRCVMYYRILMII